VNLNSREDGQLPGILRCGENLVQITSGAFNHVLTS